MKNNLRCKIPPTQKNNLYQRVVSKTDSIKPSNLLILKDSTLTTLITFRKKPRCTINLLAKNQCFLQGRDRLKK